MEYNLLRIRQYSSLNNINNMEDQNTPPQLLFRFIRMGRICLTY